MSILKYYVLDAARGGKFLDMACNMCYPIKVVINSFFERVPSWCKQSRAILFRFIMLVS